MTYKRLPIYKEVPQTIIESVPVLALDEDCTRCPLHKNSTTVCLPAAGHHSAKTPKVLVVGEYPTKLESDTGQPFIGEPGRYLRSILSENWDGGIILDNAVRCSTGGKAPGQAETHACRNYLAGTIAEVRPERIIAMGSAAIFSLTGRAVAPFSVRKGYGFLNDGTPVFFTINQAYAMRNRFMRQWLEEDLVWALKAPKPKPLWSNAVSLVIATPEDAEKACEWLKEGEFFAYDVETVGAQFDDFFKIVCLAASRPDSGQTMVWDEDALNDPACIEPLKKIMSDASVKKIGQNVKYDNLSLRCDWGIDPRGIIGDTRLWRKMLETDVDARLDMIAELVGMGGHKREAKEALVKAKVSVQKARKDSEKSLPLPGMYDDRTLKAVELSHLKPEAFIYGMLPWDTTVRYNARDALSTAKAGKVLMQRLHEEPHIHRIWNKIVGPASRALEQVEYWGMHVEKDRADILNKRLTWEQGELSKKLKGYGDFNPDSPKSLKEFLFGKLGLPVVKYTEKGAESTDTEALTKLASKHEVAKDLLRWRRIGKIRGTYAEGLMKHIRSDGRIHPNLKLDGTRSGRLSCSDPNLQNIPRSKTMEGKMVKDLFTAQHGKVMMNVDYSQLELRIAAMLSKDQDMADIYILGQDYHQKTAEMVARTAWGIDPSKVTDEHRTKAKIFNFGILYGMSAGTLAKNLNCSQSEAQKIMDALFGGFTGLKTWMQEQLTAARKTGVTWTYWDGEKARRRSLHHIGGHEDGLRITAENSSSNTPIQGTASDYCLASLVAVVDWIISENFPAKLVVSVHDSLVFEVEEWAVEELAWKCTEIMTSWPSASGFHVPLTVDIEIGPTWGDMSKYLLTA